MNPYRTDIDAQQRIQQLKQAWVRYVVECSGCGYEPSKPTPERCPKCGCYRFDTSAVRRRTK